MSSFVFSVGVTIEQRMSEHLDAYRKGEERKSAVAEHAHAWKEHHPILLQGTGVIDRASRYRDEGEGGTAQSALQPRCVGLELPGCWVSTLKALRVPTIIGLIGKRFPLFSMNVFHPEPVITSLVT